MIIPRGKLKKKLQGDFEAILNKKNIKHGYIKMRWGDMRV